MINILSLTYFISRSYIMNKLFSNDHIDLTAKYAMDYIFHILFFTQK